jgi:phosphoribosylaminoimidazole-succinocarboxamide synthase
MLVKKAKVIPIECVARGYLAGTSWKEYHRTHAVCGIALPAGLKQCDKLPRPIFTPAIKDASGQDVNITFEELVVRVGSDLANELRDRTLAIYATAANYAASRGVIIADTKLEFGKIPEGRSILIDDVLTPDSSRFWPADDYEPGHDQASFDKQYVRNYLDAQPWNRTDPAPELPPEVVMGTRERYLQAYRKLTGKDLNLG